MAWLSRCPPPVLGADRGIGRRDHSSVNDHDGVPRPQPVDPATATSSLGLARRNTGRRHLAGHARILGAVARSDHHDPVGVGDIASAFAVEVKAAAATGALEGTVRKSPGSVVQHDRTREAANPSPMRVVKSASADAEPLFPSAATAVRAAFSVA